MRVMRKKAMAGKGFGVVWCGGRECGRMRRWFVGEL